MVMSGSGMIASGLLQLVEFEGSAVVLDHRDHLVEEVAKLSLVVVGQDVDDGVVDVIEVIEHRSGEAPLTPP